MSPRTLCASCSLLFFQSGRCDRKDGKVTDARPVSLGWDIVGDMLFALKDGVACWIQPGNAAERSLTPEGEVVLAGGLWPTGIAKTKSMVIHRNRTLSYNVAAKRWQNLPPPPFLPGRTQGGCIGRSLIIISGADGGTVGARVMRLSKSLPASRAHRVLTAGEWRWDTALPALPPIASRMLAVATSIGTDWLVIGLGSPGGTGTKAGALIMYRLRLASHHGQVRSQGTCSHGH